MRESRDENRNPRVDPKLLERARKMRHVAAPTEILMWRVLRNRQLNGFKFRRQEPVCGFITDFVCVETKVIVELDGDSHSDQMKYDANRTRILRDAGYRVIRFENPEIYENLEGVLEDLLAILEGKRR